MGQQMLTNMQRAKFIKDFFLLGRDGIGVGKTIRPEAGKQGERDSIPSRATDFSLLCNVQIGSRPN
jgi:hypothetical protein